MKQILCIDDKSEMLFLYEISLKEAINSVISTAQNGMDALEKCFNQKYDLIVCDYRMPKMNGIEFIEKLKNTPNINSNTPIIFISSLLPILPKDKTNWEDVSFIEKPFSNEHFKFVTKCILEVDKEAS